MGFWTALKSIFGGNSEKEKVLDEAMKEGAPIVNKGKGLENVPKGFSENVTSYYEFGHGDLNEGFSKADKIIERNFKNNHLPSSEISKLIVDQYKILQKIAEKHNESVTHIKPHGALNNMACEDIELATILAQTIKDINKELIYLVPTGSKMQEAAKKLNMKIACEIFADRNYEDDGNLVSRKKSNALITDPEIAKKHVLTMVKNQALNCHSGKQIPCEIDSVCIHGDNMSSLNTAKIIKENLLENGLKLKKLNEMEKFL